MGRFLVGDEWVEALWDYERTAFHLELQPAYTVGEEPLVQRFLAGDLTQPDWSGWWDKVRAATAEGKHIRRVRVFEDPPTDYQRWLRWVSQWNTEAGEEIRYMTRGAARECGLLPAAGKDDWWLFDSSWLLVMRFNDAGRYLSSEVVTDPDRVEQARQWWDLAVHHSTPDSSGCASVTR